MTTRRSQDKTRGSRVQRSWWVEQMSLYGEYWPNRQKGARDTERLESQNFAFTPHSLAERDCVGSSSMRSGWPKLFKAFPPGLFHLQIGS